MIFVYTIIFILFCVHFSIQYTFPDELECGSGTRYNTSASAYYPDYQSIRTRDYVDEKGNNLRSLQEYLDGRSSHVTVSMDASLGILYGTTVCIPELNNHYGRYINLEVRDTSPDMFGCGYECIEICVRTEADSYDQIVNKEHITLVISNIEQEEL